MALTIVALKDIEVKVGDVLDAYITAPITEKVWTILGPELVPDTGKSALIVRALYGLKSAGTAFCAHLALRMRKMGFTSCKADPDLWLKATTRPDNNSVYYSYILGYVNDILVVHHNAMSILNQLNEYLPLKPSLVGDPNIYLGSNLRHTRLDNGVVAWGMSPSKYVHQGVKDCSSRLTEKFSGKYPIPARADNPFPTDYESILTLLNL